MSNNINLSIIIPSKNESQNLSFLVPKIHQTLNLIGIKYEILICDEYADRSTTEICQHNDTILHKPQACGYGSALASGFTLAKGEFIITMDADLSHPAEFLEVLWQNRNSADVLIASRYVKGGHAIMPVMRKMLSHTLNLVFSRGLDLHIRDMSSGYRMYRSSFLKNRQFFSQNFNILQELLVYAYVDGYQIREIPFIYQPRRHGSSHARVIRFGIEYIKMLPRLWLMRNSISSADYDTRAYYTWLIPQRYWQRRRFHIITQLINNQSMCLDAGCGSSQIIKSLPRKSIPLDIQLSKLRYVRKYNQNCLNASVTDLPLPDQSIPCIICSQVIEHIPRGKVLDELDRVLANDGLLILGTPDYGKWQWILTEKIYKLVLPQAYADEHITHYTYQELFDEFINKRGYSLDASKYILQGELIMILRKSQHKFNGKQK